MVQVKFRALHGYGGEGDSVGPHRDGYGLRSQGGSVVSGTELHGETARPGRALPDGLGTPRCCAA